MTAALTSRPAKMIESTSFLFLDFGITVARAMVKRIDAAASGGRRPMPQAYER
jgi:hypothetical protein